MTNRIFRVVTATIANGSSLSGAIALGGGGVLQGVSIPSAWTAAGLSFQTSFDNGTTYQNAYFDDAGTDTEIIYPTTANARNLSFEPNIFAGATHIKVRSGTSGTPVNQGAERVLTLAVESFGR